MQYLFIGILLSAALVAQEEPPLGQGVNLFSVKEEVELGRTAAEAFRKAARMVKPAGRYDFNALIEVVTKRLQPQHTFTVEIFDDSQPFARATDAMPHPRLQTSEAVAFPDGSLFVPKTLLEKAKSEEAVLRILAHGIAHVADRHVTRLKSRMRLVGLAVDGMPPEMRRQHTHAYTQTEQQQREAFEKRADVLAGQWLRVTGQRGREPSRD